MASYSKEVARMGADIDEMLAHYHDNDVEIYTILNNTITLHDHMKRALARNEKAEAKPYECICVSVWEIVKSSCSYFSKS